MRALQFMADPEPWPWELPDDAPRLLRNLATTPLALVDLPDPPLLGDDWLVLSTRLCGICGSDTKQVLMDFEGGADNMMTAFVSFPQVLGHEVVATVDEAGSGVDGLEPGRRVVLYPNLGCRARGIRPLCPACERGDYAICANFHSGRLSAGIHTGNAVEATGGFAERLPAHETMAVPVPDGVLDELAVLADPWSVSFHAVTRHPPAPGARAVVYGAGALGSTATAILRQLHPDVEVATIARWPAQAELAGGLGAAVFAPDPEEALVEALAAWSGATLRRPWEGLPVAYPGGIDVVYDTVGTPASTEVSLRVLRERGTLVQLGVSSPGRFEWTPWYFKELHLVGSNAFGDETFEGRRRHAYEHYFALLADGRIDLSGLLTHRFRLEQWRDAFTALVHQGNTGAIKVAFDFR
ncbi:MAG TPA: alcohol dehydrogenase catalytic domain-containing protein [Acidimicrobiales bacterium]|nr:alcohol dehydrogenase catalytic domain-containing protein [Acidimicrobiales bacterium]